MAVHFEVPLPCGRRLLIDPTGFDKIKHLSWQTVKNQKQDKYYVHHVRREKCADGLWRATHLLLARFLKDLEKGDLRVADHINGNPLDNRWINLRVCSGPQNVCNRRISKNNTSGFKGVSKTKHGRWTASIAYKSKTYYLGTFDTPEEAHSAYCDAAIKFHGEFANFGVEVPPPGPGIEIYLPSSIDFMRAHLPDPTRHARVKMGMDGRTQAIGIPSAWSEWRSPFTIGKLASDKEIHDRAYRRFLDLEVQGMANKESRCVALALLTAAEVGFDRAQTVKVSHQKYPVVVQVFKNMIAAGLWKEWESGSGVRWGFEYGWAPEDELDRRKFGEEFARHVKMARAGVDVALQEWRHGIKAAQAATLEMARRERLARPENQPYLRASSRLRPVQMIRNIAPNRSGLRVKL